MKAVIVISAKAFDQYALAEAYKAVGNVDIQSATRIVVEGVCGCFAVNADDAIVGDFDDEELARLNNKIRQPYFYNLEFRTPLAADVAILNLPADKDVLIDNDHGLLTTLEEIRGRIRVGNDWQTVSR